MGEVLLTDQQIAELIAEPKPLKDGPAALLHLRAGAQRHRREVEVTGDSGQRFRLLLTQPPTHPRRFSVVRFVRLAGRSRLFRLRRYNSPHGALAHRNKIEDETIENTYHVHTATARYQRLGLKEDNYAVATDRFDSLPSALACALAECGFYQPGDSRQLNLPGLEEQQ